MIVNNLNAVSATIEAYSQSDLLCTKDTQTKDECDSFQAIDNSSTPQQFHPCHAPCPSPMQAEKFPGYTPPPPPAPPPIVKFDALRKFR